jgi:hypothetical protein
MTQMTVRAQDLRPGDRFTRGDASGFVVADVDLYEDGYHIVVTVDSGDMFAVTPNKRFPSTRHRPCTTHSSNPPPQRAVTRAACRCSITVATQ